MVRLQLGFVFSAEATLACMCLLALSRLHLVCCAGVGAYEVRVIRKRALHRVSRERSDALQTEHVSAFASAVFLNVKRTKEYSLKLLEVCEW